MTTDHRSQPADLVAVLTALRPDRHLDGVWDPAEQAAVLDRITAIAHDPGDRPVPRRGLRRPLVAATTGALVLAGGVGAAAAGGLVPQAFLDAFAGWQHFPAEGGSREVDLGTAHRAATADGPDGTVFSVVTAAAVDDPDYVCTVALFETPASVAGSGPSDFTEASSNWCGTGATDAAFGSATSVDVVDGYWVWWVPAGDAVAGRLTTATGETYPVVEADGTLFGWFPAPADGAPPAQLVGLAADGTEVGRASV